jgi:hypothetical protein
MAALTDALRDGGSNETCRLAERLLLTDLALVAAQFRGRTNALNESLTRALEALAAAARS